MHVVVGEVAKGLQDQQVHLYHLVPVGFEALVSVHVLYTVKEF